MSKIIDLKSLGISQDVKELKSEKARSSRYYNQGNEKKKLALMQEAHRISYKSEASKENKETGLSLVKEGNKKLAYEEKIAKQKQKISSNSFLGRAKQGLSRVGSKINKFANERAINRQVVRKSNVSVRASSFNSPVENVFEDENRFFKGEMAKEKKAMYFS
jgi:hypothetical protein